MSKSISAGENWNPDKETRAWGEKHLPLDVFNDELSKFRCYDRFQSPRANWNPAFRKWLQRAIERYNATAPCVGEEDARQQRTRNYSKPSSPSNPGGNPHNVTLPDHIAERRVGELIEHYERRIAAAITQSKYR